MSRREDERTQREGAASENRAETAAPAVETAAPASDLVARTLAMQQGAGNQAVARMIAAQGPVLARRNPRRVEEKEHTVAELRDMTLSDFHDYTREQADWRQTPTMRADRAFADKLRNLLEFAEAGQVGAGATADRPVVNACGDFKVGELLDKSSADQRRALRKYSEGFMPGTPTVTVEKAPDLDTALAWGSAIVKLESVIPQARLSELVKQAEGRNDLKRLISGTAWRGGPGGNQVDAFVDFVQRGNPLLTATNGAEIVSFLALSKTGPAVDWVGKVPRVRNVHHFEADALKTLSDNWKAGNKDSKPLALILHSAEDHNGAFHHDKNLTKAITDSRNFTLMVEGMSSLAEAGDQVEELATRYGVGGKLRQVMIAGHGEAYSMNLATKEGPDGQLEHERFAAQGPSADETKRLFERILATMERGPQARVLLNACLTATHKPLPMTGALDPNAPTDEAGAAQAIRAGVQANPALADHLREMADTAGFGADTINAASASFTSETGLIDPATGQFGFTPPAYDPNLTARDRIEYVRMAGEPEGAMRAVLELWGMAEHGAPGTPGHMPAAGIGPAPAHSMADLEAALDARIGGAKDRWDDQLIIALFKIVKRNLNNGALINELTHKHVAYALSHVKRPNDASLDRIRDVPAAFADELYTGLEEAIKASNAKVQLVVYQHWALHNAAKQEKVLEVLGGYSCKEAANILEFFTLVEWGLVEPMLATARAGAAEAGRLRLALFDANFNGEAMYEDSKTLLRGMRDADNKWGPNEATINAALGGMTDADAILAAIEEPVPAGGGGAGGRGGGGRRRRQEPDFNVDLDQRADNRNDIYVEPMARTGAVTATRLNVRERPGMSHDIIGSVDEGAAVMVIGKVRSWYAIEWRNRTAFVYSGYVNLTPNP